MSRGVFTTIFQIAVSPITLPLKAIRTTDHLVDKGLSNFGSWLGKRLDPDFDQHPKGYDWRENNRQYWAKKEATGNASGAPSSEQDPSP